MAGTSLAVIQSRQQTSEKVKTYAPAYVNDLIAEGASLSQTLKEEANRSTSAPAGPRSPWYDGDAEVESLRERARQQRSILEAQQTRREAALRTALARRKEADARRSDAAFNTMLSEVMAGLSGSRSDTPNDSRSASPATAGPAPSRATVELLADTDAALAHKAKISRKKKEALHREWTGQVFDTIQGRLQSAVDARDPRDIEARLKQHYDAYLHTTNTKVGVFRDVIIEQDYNPLTANTAAIRIPTGDIRDPLKRDMLKGEYERQLMSAGSGSLRSSGGAGLGRQALGKETLDPKHWGDGAIHATPYGHCVDQSGAYIVRPLSGSAVALRSSRIPMDHYNYPVGNEHAAAEVPPGKRIVPGPEQLRGRQDLYDVVQHTCHTKPAFTGGDRWLEAKGKAPAPGPEVRRGRRDLCDVLHQKVLSDGLPRRGDTTLGDTWLDAKGKARPAGPEERRGRAGLYTTLQQTSNPYVHHDGVGDLWMEHKGRRVLPALPTEAGAALMAAPPPPRPPHVPDERKYGGQLGPVDGHFTVKEGC